MFIIGFCNFYRTGIVYLDTSITPFLHSYLPLLTSFSKWCQLLIDAVIRTWLCITCQIDSFCVSDSFYMNWMDIYLYLCNKLVSFEFDFDKLSCRQ